MPPEPLSASSDLFEYRSLEQPIEIRVVILGRGSGTDPIECLIFHAGLGEQQYQALSYEWGSPKNNAFISIDGCPVSIRRNLYEGLLQIRSATEDLYLWIDALCIDQANSQERNHQVGMMGKIYSGAESVIVWLGVAQDDSDVAIEKLADQRLQHLIVSDSLDMTEQQALVMLCHRSYWRRAWILQELYLAKSYVLWCGSKSISEDRFGSALATLNRFDAPPEDFAGRFKYCAAIAKSPANKLRFTNQLRDTPFCTMGRWLRMSLDIDLKSAQPRDLIYAMLAISSDCSSSQIMPDYEKPLQDVYLETLMVCNRTLHNQATDHTFEQRLAAKLGLIMDEELERCISKIVGFQAP